MGTPEFPSVIKIRSFFNACRLAAAAERDTDPAAAKEEAGDGAGLDSESIAPVTAAALNAVQI